MKKSLFKIIPKSLRRKIFSTVELNMFESRAVESDSIPKFDLEEKHIKNTKLIPNRVNLLELLPKNGIVAELGVDEGGFSEMILQICEPQKLHLVDFWGSERYDRIKQQGVENKFSEQMKNGTLEINLGLSTEVVSGFQDDYFDWIYIDTDHSYKTTIQELETYRTKMKSGGIIAGHDYIVGNWIFSVRYGVIEAVYEFCTKYNWEIIYLTTEISTHQSFAIRKITD